jgi:arginyl-tRNA synthetase
VTREACATRQACAERSRTAARVSLLDVITGDLDRLLGAAIGHGPAPSAGITSAGTWRPAPPGAAAGPGSHATPGSYATPVAFRLAQAWRSEPASVAATLAAAARRAAWVSSATVTGGYLTITVTADALASLAVRITEAGPACARSAALAGAALPVPLGPDRSAAWPQARRRLAAFQTARLAEAAGARIVPSFDHAIRQATPGHDPGGETSPVAEAVAFAGSAAITYALARLPPGTQEPPDPRRAAARHLGNPAYAVRYAHAHAASTLRQAADLGLSRGEAAGFRPPLLAHPSEQALLGELSWLAERVAGAARRARPDVFTRYLERLADSYFGCQEQCPAVRPGTGTDSPTTVARLWLAAASATALRAGLDLLGVDAPDRL